MTLSSTCLWIIVFVVVALLFIMMNSKGKLKCNDGGHGGMNIFVQDKDNTYPVEMSPTDTVQDLINRLPPGILALEFGGRRLTDTHETLADAGISSESVVNVPIVAFSRLIPKPGYRLITDEAHKFWQTLALLDNNSDYFILRQRGWTPECYEQEEDIRYVYSGMDANGNPRVVDQYMDDKIKFYPDGGVAIYPNCEATFVFVGSADTENPNDYFEDPHPLFVKVGPIPQHHWEKQKWALKT